MPEEKYVSINGFLDSLELEGGNRYLAKKALRNLLGLKIRREVDEEVIPEDQLTFAARYILNNRDDLKIEIDPLKVEELREKFELEDVALHGPAMPSATAMISPEAVQPLEDRNLQQSEVDTLVEKVKSSPSAAPQEAAQTPESGILTQDEIDDLRTKIDAEKSADPAAAPKPTPSTAYSESGSYEETAEKGNDWEDILDTRVKDEPVNKSKSRPGYSPLPRYDTRASQRKPKLSGLQAELAAQSNSTRLMRDMIKQEENERDTHQETYKTERQVSAAKPYQPVQKMISKEDAINFIIYTLEENAVPVETAEGIGPACFSAYAVRVYGLKELTEPQGSVDAQKLKEALKGFLTDFFNFSKSRDPSICDTEKFRTPEMYVMEFDNTMTDFAVPFG